MPTSPPQGSSSSTSLDLSDSLLRSSSGCTNTTTTSSTSTQSEPTRSLVRPPISYAMLITEAIQNSPEKQLILSEIYDFVQEHYPYFRTAGSGWKNSIRHNLSLNKAFRKIPRPNRAPGKGSYWKLSEETSGIRRGGELDKNSPIRRQSFPNYTTDRYQIASYPPSLNDDHPSSTTTIRPRSSSTTTITDSNFNRLPLIRPRPKFDSKSSFQYDQAQQVDPNLYFPIMMELTAGNQQPFFIPNNPPDLLRPILESKQDHFESKFSSFVVSGQEQQPQSLYHDVFIGAGTPKQQASFDITNSPIDFLTVPSTSIGNSSLPPSEIYDTHSACFLSFDDLV